MAQQLFERADVAAGLEEVGREAVAQRVRTNWLGNPGLAYRVVDGALGHRFVERKPLRWAEARVGAASTRGRPTAEVSGSKATGESSLPASALSNVDLPALTSP